jgi:hypothetical protein
MHLLVHPIVKKVGYVATTDYARRKRHQYVKAIVESSLDPVRNLYGTCSNYFCIFSSFISAVFSLPFQTVWPMTKEYSEKAAVAFVRRYVLGYVN